ncbi:MAG: hypothetical protein HQL75_11905 [Magnetococcales bacterium]|nr:hypothetical protein [Magnetococcales bacterium]
MPVGKNNLCFDSQSGPLDLEPGYGEIQDHKEHMELYYRFHNEDAGALKFRFLHRTRPEFHRRFLAMICPKLQGTYEWLPPLLCLWNGDCGERKIRFQIPEGDKPSDLFLSTPVDNDQTIIELDYIDHGDQVTITIGCKLPIFKAERAKPKKTFTGRVTGVEKHCRHRKGSTEQEDLKKCPCKGRFNSAWQRETGSGEINWYIENKAGVGGIVLVDEHLDGLPTRRCQASQVPSRS